MAQERWNVTVKRQAKGNGRTPVFLSHPTGERRPVSPQFLACPRHRRNSKNTFRQMTPTLKRKPQHNGSSSRPPIQSPPPHCPYLLQKPPAPPRRSILLFDKYRSQIQFPTLKRQRMRSVSTAHLSQPRPVPPKNLPIIAGSSDTCRKAVCPKRLLDTGKVL